MPDRGRRVAAKLMRTSLCFPSPAGAVRQMRTSLLLPSPTRALGRKKAAPLGESGSARLFEVNAVLEVTLRRKVVVDRGMDIREFLQRSHAPEPQHGTLSSPDGQVRVLHSIIHPSPHLAVIATAQVLQRGAV